MSNNNLPPLPEPDVPEGDWLIRDSYIKDYALAYGKQCRQQALEEAEKKEPVKPRRELLELAEKCGAKLTGKPDGSEAVTVVFTCEAWRSFDAATEIEGLRALKDKP